MGGVGAGGDFLHCILKLKIHFACLSVRLYPMNVKTAEQGPNLCGTSHDPSEGLWKPKITKNCGQTFLKMREKILFNQQIFVFVLYCRKRR